MLTKRIKFLNCLERMSDKSFFFILMPLALFRRVCELFCIELASMLQTDPHLSALEVRFSFTFTFFEVYLYCNDKCILKSVVFLVRLATTDGFFVCELRIVTK